MSKILNDLAELAKTIKNTQSDKELMNDDLDFITDRIENFPKYFNSIVMMEIRVEMAKFRLEGAELGGFRAELDANRRRAHILVANSINQINRLCEEYNREPVFNLPNNKEKLNSDDIEDREYAADMVYGFCKEVFLESKLKERYNNFDLDDRMDQKDAELLDMINNRDTFNGKISVDDLIKMAEEDIDIKSDDKDVSEDVCL